MDAMPLAGGADGPAARIVEPSEGIGPGIQLDIDMAHPVARGPFDALLQPRLAADIHPDPVEQRHCLPPLARAIVYITEAGWQRPGQGARTARKGADAGQVLPRFQSAAA